MERLQETRKIERRINYILSNRETSLSELDQLITEDEKAISAAAERMEAATAAGNLEEYRKAKSELAEVSDAKEMHEKRMIALSDLPLISEAEYNEDVLIIQAEVAAIEKESKQILKALSDKMKEESNLLSDCIILANGILERLQHDVFRDADRSRNPKTGEVMPINHERAQVDPIFQSTVNWGNLAVNSAQYQNYKAGLQK